MWCTHTMEYYSALKSYAVVRHVAAWKSLENTVSGKTREDKATSCTIPFIGNVQNQQIQRHGKQSGGCQGLAEGKGATGGE